MNYDNPAGRLLEVLSLASQFEKVTPARTVWVSIFRLKDKDVGPKLTAMLAKTSMLPYETYQQLEDEHPELVNPAPGWINQIAQAFQIHNVHGTIESFVGSYSKDTLSNIKMTAVLMDKGSKKKILASEKLSEMRSTIEAVLKDVIDSDEIDESIRAYLARSLRKIIIYIDEYKLTGAAPILESIEQTIGHAIVDPEYKSILSNTNIGSKVLDALQVASCIVTVATGLPVLALTAHQFLK